MDIRINQEQGFYFKDISRVLSDTFISLVNHIAMYNTFQSIPMTDDIDIKMSNLDKSLHWLASIYDISDLRMIEKIVDEEEVEGMDEKINWSREMPDDSMHILVIVRCNWAKMPRKIETDTRVYLKLYQSPEILTVVFEDKIHRKYSPNDEVENLTYTIYL